MRRWKTQRPKTSLFCSTSSGLAIITSTRRKSRKPWTSSLATPASLTTWTRAEAPTYWRAASFQDASSSVRITVACSSINVRVRSVLNGRLGERLEEPRERATSGGGIWRRPPALLATMVRRRLSQCWWGGSGSLQMRISVAMGYSKSNTGTPRLLPSASTIQPPDTRFLRDRDDVSTVRRPKTSRGPAEKFSRSRVSMRAKIWCCRLLPSGMYCAARQVCGSLVITSLTTSRHRDTFQGVVRSLLRMRSIFHSRSDGDDRQCARHARHSAARTSHT
mmetsp:Transcript_1030/g.2953  ORF Transcript_1030/g.2953 Transcript_1030/m.2953 type:complete len:277 (+) Transcript_1030:667-1497(+)